MGLGLQSAIHIAHMGMGAAEKTINVSGTNLANSNTIGYKAERADFTSFLSYNYSYGSAPGQTYTAGTNPTQIGMGVEMAGVTTNFTQGSFQEGMGPSDIAINGNGFLIVQGHNSSTPYYTRNGVLKINKNFDLVTNDGMYVLGYGVDDQFRIQTDALSTLSIPLNELHIAKATENVWIEGILNATGTAATQGNVLRTTPMTDLAKTGPDETEQLTVTQVQSPMVEGVTSATGLAAGGAVEAGDYYYRIAFVDAAGVESAYSAPISAEVLQGENAARLDNLPGVPDGYVSMRIYRAENPNNEAVQPTFYRVGEVAAGTSSYTDTLSTADISDPTKAGYQVLDQGRLVGSYQYYMTYIDAQGNESRPVIVSDTFNVNIAGQLELSDIPTVDADNNPDGWTGRRIYRTSADDPTSIHLVQQINNMDPNATVIDRVSDADLVQRNELNPAGQGNVQVNEATKLVDVGQFVNGSFVRVFEEGTLSINPTKGETSLRDAELEITSETTVGDYLNFLNDVYGLRGADSGVPADQGAIGQTVNGGYPGAAVIDGSFYLLSNTGEKNALEILSGTMTLTPTGGEARRVDLGWTQVQEAVGESIVSDMQVYDSLGAPVSVRMTFVLESVSDTETVYRWYADSPDNQPSDGSAIATGTGLLRFDQNGRIIGTPDGSISVQRTAVASESPLDFDFHVNFDALKALSTTSAGVTQTEQDGAAAGTLYDHTILEDGTIMGIFTSGVQRPLGQILLATFRNQEGLYKAGDSLYMASSNSGDARITVPGEDGTGSIKGNSLELSNSDIAQEIVNMILASSMYRSNAKVMTTANEMFDALLRIV